MRVAHDRHQTVALQRGRLSLDDGADVSAMLDDRAALTSDGTAPRRPLSGLRMRTRRELAGRRWPPAPAPQQHRSLGARSDR
eukprot:4151583-Prymnesium_polylepis.1